MMRAIKFSARLGFKIERKTLAAIEKLHSCILSASVPRVCEEVFRLFPYGKSEDAFRSLWSCGMLGDLLPELSAWISANGGKNCIVWRHLAGLDTYEIMMSQKGFETPNSLRAAVLMTGFCRSFGREGAGRAVMQTMMNSLKMPKATYFASVLFLESAKRLSSPPTRGKMRFIYNRDFLDALDYNRIILRAEGRDESALNAWADLYEEKGTEE